MWTVLVNDDNPETYYFEVDLFLPNNPIKKIVYRFVVLFNMPIFTFMDK